ncbi:TonB-dependent siderophore receptor [Paracoccus versutus]|uniref:TonB-dependent siderophore receptor n=1 Tax=Paracoccus versutus TaxID=34007 RepID=UPI0015F0CDF0|nr:TonB-dependent receptor [Paracoccus versutus]
MTRVDRNDKNRTRAVIARLLASAMLCGGVLGSAVPAQAQTAQATAFSVPAGPLDQALAVFGRQAHIQVSALSSLTAGKQSPGVTGHVTPAQALDQLLSQSGLAYDFTAPNTVVLSARLAAAESADPDAVVLEQITLVGAGNSVTEGTGSYTTGAMSAATGLSLAVHETPQAVTVMTRQQIEDQASTSFEDVARNATGLSLEKWGDERPRIYSRGFYMGNIMLDGQPVEFDPDTFTSSTLAMYDHVEVVRGATGLMTGTGDPSGVVNFVTKRAPETTRFSATSSIGTWNTIRSEIDYGGPLNDAGTLRGRIVAAGERADSYIDYRKSRRGLLFGTIAADIGPATTLTFGAYATREDNPGADWNGRGTAPDGSFLDIPRSARMSPSWSYWDKQTHGAYVEIQHDFDNGWQAQASARAANTFMQMRGTFLSGPSVADDGSFTFGLRGGLYEYHHSQQSLGATMSGPVTLFGRDHELVFGVNHRRTKADDAGGSYTTADGNFDIATLDPYTWDPAIPVPETFGLFGLWGRQSEVRQTGLWGTGRFSVADRTKVIAGARLDWYEQESTSVSGDWSATQAYSEDAHFTPYLGVIQELNDTYSVYASYTKVFKPQDYQGPDGAYLKPVTGENIELGLKGTYLDERVNMGLSLFRTRHKNRPTPLPVEDCMEGLYDCYRAVGEVESKGVDLEISGEVLPRWNLMLGYTYNKAEITADSTDGVAGSPYNTFLPRHLLKIATMYHLPGDQWRIGGSMRLQSEINSKSNAVYDAALRETPVRQGGYAIVDLVAGYRVNDNFDIQLNVNNVFGRDYYEVVDSFSGGNFIGEPRNVLLTGKVTF